MNKKNAEILKKNNAMTLELYSHIETMVLSLVGRTTQVITEITNLFSESGQEVIRRAKLIPLEAEKIEKLESIFKIATSRQNEALEKGKAHVKERQSAVLSAMRGAPATELDIGNGKLTEIANETVKEITGIYGEAGRECVDLCDQIFQSVAVENFDKLRKLISEVKSEILKSNVEINNKNAALMSKMKKNLSEIDPECPETDEKLAQWKQKITSIMNNAESMF